MRRPFQSDGVTPKGHRDLSRWVLSAKGRENLPCVFPFSASAHRGKQLSPSSFSINFFLAPPHQHSYYTDIHWATCQWQARSWQRKVVPIHMDEGTPFPHWHTSQAAQGQPPSSIVESSSLPMLPPCAPTQGHIPCSLCRRALHRRQGCLAGPAFLLAISSRSLTNHWLATWTWNLHCVMYGWVGGWNRNLYWGVQSYCNEEGSYDSWIQVFLDSNKSHYLM